MLTFTVWLSLWLADMRDVRRELAKAQNARITAERLAEEAKDRR